MQTQDMRKVKITEGFFKELQKLNEEVSVYNIYKRFEETGRFRAIKCVKDEAHKPHIFWDSDVAKWLEGVAYILVKKKDDRLEALAREAIDDICANQLPCGYFNSYYQVYAPEKIFTERTEHELYCAGHLIEAAVALRQCGVDEKLYGAMLRYADYIYERFYVKKDAAFTTCGHPEIELALVKLYRESGDKKYLDLADFFIEERGRREEEHYGFTDGRYDQSDLPVREQREAKGHAVRALYLFIAAADVAQIKGDEGLIAACERVFEDIVNRKMYITGGTGSTYHGEAFTFAYDLPNIFAYAETCSAIALALFADRMAKIENKAIYHEIFERVVYNNVLAGESKDGKGFYYVNPLEMHENIYDYNESLKTKLYCPLPERVEVFDCSCCPPNLIRFVENIGSFIYGFDEDKKRIFVGPEQRILRPEPFCSGIVVPQILLKAAFCNTFIGDVGIGTAVYVSFVVHITVICHILQINIGEIFAQCNMAHFLEPLCLKAFLYVVIQNAFRCDLVAFPEQIFQSIPHPLGHELIFIDDRPGQPFLYTESYAQIGEQQSEDHKSHCVLQISSLYSRFFVLPLHIIVSFPNISYPSYSFRYSLGSFPVYCLNRCEK